MLNKIFILAALISLIAVLVFAPKVLRVYKMIHLYDQDKIAFNFINMNKIFLTGPIISASEKPFNFQFNEFILPKTYDYKNKDKNLLEAT